MTHATIAAVSTLTLLFVLSGPAAAGCVGVSEFNQQNPGAVTVGYLEQGQIVFVCSQDVCTGVYSRPCTLPIDALPTLP